MYCLLSQTQDLTLIFSFLFYFLVVGNGFMLEVRKNESEGICHYRITTSLSLSSLPLFILLKLHNSLFQRRWSRFVRKSI